MTLLLLYGKGRSCEKYRGNVVVFMGYGQVRLYSEGVHEAGKRSTEGPNAFAY